MSSSASSSPVGCASTAGRTDSIEGPQLLFAETTGWDLVCMIYPFALRPHPEPREQRVVDLAAINDEFIDAMLERFFEVARESHPFAALPPEAPVTRKFGFEA